eukprot:9152058-Heterocapsa_arctica.AAC.1
MFGGVGTGVGESGGPDVAKANVRFVYFYILLNSVLSRPAPSGAADTILDHPRPPLTCCGGSRKCGRQPLTGR